MLLIELRRFADERGSFAEAYRRDQYEALGMHQPFVQDNLSRSVRGVLRGVHFQVRRPQAQLVTIVRGRVFDVAVDLRPQSPTFGKWFGTELSDESACQVYMAPGFGHGFCVLSDVADLHYRVSRYYDPDDEAGLVWNDPDVGIRWPIEPTNISRRDASHPRLRSIPRDRLPHGPPRE